MTSTDSISTMKSMSADELRDSFLDFFAAKGHTLVPSASLIPHDPTVLFTVAGMVPFKPYFVGDEAPPYTRAVSVAEVRPRRRQAQRPRRRRPHASATSSFFEMLGNFSFGDYFKDEAIPWAGSSSPRRSGSTATASGSPSTTTDDEAEAIWHEQVGVPMERIQRLGDKDNFWQMGDTGPCGPC